MNTKGVIILVAFILACLLPVAPVIAQQRGHAGGLGEARIQFNFASAANLAKAPGITPAIADAIVKYRMEEKPFKKADDLLKVKGITAEVLKQINPQVGTEGDLYTLPRAGETLEEEKEDAPLGVSKC